MAKYIVVHSVRVCTEFTPEIYGRLTTIGPAFQLREYRAYQVCRCACGVIGIYPSVGMRAGKTQSCGCYHKEQTSKSRTTHGLSSSAEYEVWTKITKRCRSTKDISYPNYGARGIIMCQRWEKFENFFADMGPKPTQKHSIERIDNDGNYEPSNCCWATRLEQNNNTRRNRYITITGQTKTLAEWCRLLGLPYKQTHKRLSNAHWRTAGILN